MNVLKNLKNIQNNSLLKESFNEDTIESIRYSVWCNAVTHSGNLPE